MSGIAEHSKTLARHCHECGNLFWVNPNRFKHTPQLYCSTRCQRKNAFSTGHGLKTEETRNKISESLRGEKNPNYGKPRSKETRKRISDAQKGRLSNNWKGGVTKERVKAWFTPEYKKWRKAVLERDEYICSLCGIDVVGTKRYCVHHIIQFHEDVRLRLNVDNGITLCAECHHILTSLERLGVPFCPLPKTCNKIAPLPEQSVNNNPLNSVNPLRERGNTEPSPDGEGVETRQGTPARDEGIVQTTNADAAAKAVDGRDARMYFLGRL